MGTGREAHGLQVMGETVGPGVELAVGEAYVTRNQRQAVGHGVHHQLEQVGQVELSVGHVVSPLSPCGPAVRPGALGRVRPGTARPPVALPHLRVRSMLLQNPER